MSNPGIYGASPSNPLVTPALSSLAEPELKQVDGAAFDYLIIEAVRTLRQSSAVATARIREREQEMIEAGLLPPVAPPAVPPRGRKDSQDTISSVTNSRTNAETEEALSVRLEAMGTHVGSNIAEKLTKDHTRFTDTLDVIKFLCKEVWVVVWDKQVDNLRTNHRGVYVLQDNAFKPLLRISTAGGPQDALKRARIYLAFPTGILRGALVRLGLQATVHPETAILPQCTFQIKLPKGV